MTDWSKLDDAYGPATDVPGLLAQLDPDPEAPVWNELYGRLYHQGSVYSASFAALPALEEAARSWPPQNRVMALVLAAGIVTGAPTNALGLPEDLRREVAPTRVRLLELALEAVALPGRDRIDFIYLLQATRALMDDVLWGEHLEGLADGEFHGACPRCRRSLSLFIGPEGTFATTDDWPLPPEPEREPIVAAAELPPDGLWMLEQAEAAQQSDLVRLLPLLFGSSRCPHCASAFDVPSSLEIEPYLSPYEG